MAPNEPEKWGCRVRIRDLFSKISRLIQYYETKKTTGAPAPAAPASLAPMYTQVGGKIVFQLHTCSITF